MRGAGGARGRDPAHRSLPPSSPVLRSTTGEGDRPRKRVVEGAFGKR